MDWQFKTADARIKLNSLYPKFTAKYIHANTLEEKYSLKLSKELELFKSNIENKKYISRTKFDTEFQIFKVRCH